MVLQAEDVRREPGSFRDPSGGVIEARGEIFRYFTGERADAFRRFLESPLAAQLTADGRIIESTPVDPQAAPELYACADDVRLVVQHPRLPFVSYPYEWPFEMLKAAALLQLDVTQTALRQGYMVKDATPYNVQFDGARPVFIDVASFEAHEAGAGWRGYAQFCRSFLNPLLLQAKTGVPFQPWLRSSLDGIDVDHARSLLPFRSKFRPGVFMDVVLQSWLGHRFARDGRALRRITSRPVPDGTVAGLLARMQRQVTSLKRRRARTAWGDYETEKAHYSPAAEAFKEAFVLSQLSDGRPGSVWDLGCNAGQYSVIAADCAGYVVAMDSDELAVGRLYERIAGKRSNILPLVVDLMNPSPDQGWDGTERKGLAARGRADWALCLALVHHLAIAGNVPLARIAAWLAPLTRYAIVEFVPKADPMVQRLLSTRQDVHPEYTEDGFRHAFEAHFTVLERAEVPESGRVLYVVESR